MNAREQVRNLVLFGIPMEVVVGEDLAERLAEEGIDTLGDLVQKAVEEILRKQASVSVLGLSERVERGLISSGFDTVEKFLTLSSERDIHLRVRRVGAKSLPEINQVRMRLGFPALTKN